MTLVYDSDSGVGASARMEAMNNGEKISYEYEPAPAYEQPQYEQQREPQYEQPREPAYEQPREEYEQPRYTKAHEKTREPQEPVPLNYPAILSLGVSPSSSSR